jgi:hypothetical protein
MLAGIPDGLIGLSPQVAQRGDRPAAGCPGAAGFERLSIGMAHASTASPEEREAVVAFIREAWKR